MKPDSPEGEAHNESCLDLAHRLGAAAGVPFENLPEEEKLRLLRATILQEMPFLAALYDDAAEGDGEAGDDAR